VITTPWLYAPLAIATSLRWKRGGVHLKPASGDVDQGAISQMTPRCTSKEQLCVPPVDPVP